MPEEKSGTAPAAAPGRRRRIRFTLFFKALLLVLATTLVPLAILGTLGIQRALESVDDAARKDLQLVANLTATRLDQLFVDTQRLQRMIADNRLVTEALASPKSDGIAFGRLQEMLGSMVAQNPDLALVYLADAKGICLASTSPDMVGRDYRATRDYMRRALEGESYVSEMNMGITTREPGVFFSGPVYDRPSPPAVTAGAPTSAPARLLGAVVLKIKGSVIDRICNDVNRSLAGGIAGVADSRQVIISHPNKERLYRSIGRLPPEVARQIDPKLDYGVDAVQSLGLDDVAGELRQGHARGNLTFHMADDEVDIVGYARMTHKAWTAFVVQPRDVFSLPVRQLSRTFRVMLIVVGVASSLLAGLATWGLLRPVKALERAARKASQGDWSARAEVVSGDELGDLARTFNEMMPQLQERTHMQQALRLAMDVQRHLLPAHAPQVPGLDVDGVNVAADETGGDYFDFLNLSHWQDGSLAVAVGDVTGHGVSAALLMATARGMVRSQATPPGGLAQLITHVNTHLCDDVPSGHFMTLMYAIIDRPRQQIRLVSAGHDPILEYSPREDEFRELAGSDLPMGFEAGWQFHEHVYSLREDAILLLGTDGIWETFSPAGEQFGTERLKQVIRENAHKDASGIKESVLEAVRAFRGDGPQMDDVTVVIVKMAPLEAELRPLAAALAVEQG